MSHQFSSCAGRQGWLPPPPHQGGRHEVVPDQVRRCDPLQQGQVVCAAEISTVDALANLKYTILVHLDNLAQQ